MQLPHDDIFDADVVEPLRRVRATARLILGEEVNAVRIRLVRAVTDAEGEVAWRTIHQLRAEAQRIWARG